MIGHPQTLTRMNQEYKAIFETIRQKYNRWVKQYIEPS